MSRTQCLTMPEAAVTPKLLPAHKLENKMNLHIGFTAGAGNCIVRRRTQIHFMLIVLTLLLNVAASQLMAEESTAGNKVAPGENWAVELPRIPPSEPREAQSLFTVKPEIRLELVANEPLVVDPVAMAFDSSGALYVVEMRGYSEQADEHLGRVRRLVDVDGDGIFDESTVFVEGLSWPTAVCCSDGGVYVAAAPDVIFLRDNDADGVADDRATIFTGLGHSNVQGLVNSFQWGLDNRIYAAVSSSGARLKHVAASAGGVLNLQGRDFSFDPRTNIAEPATGGGQHGMCFNRWGDRFVCSNSDHLQAIVFEERYLQANPYQAAPGPRRSIAVDGPQAEVFRTSRVEPWRVLRTKMRVSGFAPGMIEGGGRASGYFTSATGITIDEGGLNEESEALVADVGSNLIHRKRLIPDGVTYRGERIDQDSELIASSDNWFRPVQMGIGPEGAIYVADMYRETIEHPLSLPPQIKKQLDLTSGRNRGRIYRIVPADYQYQAPRALADASVAELAEALEHPNMWRRMAAARLLYERQDVSVVPQLRSRLETSSNPVAKISILYALDGLDSLEDQQLLAGLADSHPQVRRHSLRLAETRFDTAPELLARACSLVRDPEIVVRFQLALSLGASANSRVAKALADLVQHTENADVIAAALISAHSNAGAMLEIAVQDESWMVQPTGQKVIAALISQIKRQQRPADLSELKKLLTTTEPSLASPAAEALVALGPFTSEEYSETSGDMASVLAAQRKSLEAYLPVAIAALESDETPGKQRNTAIRLIALGDLEPVRTLLTEQLTNPGQERLAKVALDALGKRQSPLVATILLSAWDRMDEEQQNAAATLLCSRDTWAKQLLSACESDRVQFADLPTTCTMSLCNSTKENIQQRAQVLRGKNVPVDRQTAFREYLDVLNEPGDPVHGRELFTKHCALCHQVQGEGYEVGPNLTAMANRGAESLLYNILVPNAEIDPRYASIAIATTDGRVLTGLVAAETANSVTLKGPQGEVTTVLRVDIDEIFNSGVSLMPEGLEKSINKSAMADLLSFIQNSASGKKGSK